MVGLVVVSHGCFAQELVDAARTILGHVEAFEAVSIDWNDDVDRARQEILDAIKRADRGRGVLVLTDMFGGTPSNLALSMHDPGRIDIVTGVNLPMLIRHADLSGEIPLAELAERLATEGRQSIRVASKLLASERGTDEGGER